MSRNILYVCVLTVLLYPHIYYGCPTECSCIGTTTNCDNKALTEIPSGIPETTEILSLLHNEITRLPEGLFLNNFALTKVFLNNNQITSLPEGLFSCNPALTMVSLSNNQITSLPEGLFLSNPALTMVILDNNQITSLPEGLFSCNPALTSVFFYHNQIRSFPEGLFSNKYALRQVHFVDNLIKTVSPNVFTNAGSISGWRIYLHSNPLLCCYMSDFIDWTQDEATHLVALGTCTEPTNTDVIEFGSFNTSECPQVDGQWSNWSKSSCSTTCRVGNINRTRECDNPKPSKYGQRCEGVPSDVIQCFGDCPTDEDFDWVPLTILVW